METGNTLEGKYTSGLADLQCLLVRCISVTCVLVSSFGIASTSIASTSISSTSIARSSVARSSIARSSVARRTVARSSIASVSASVITALPNRKLCAVVLSTSLGNGHENGLMVASRRHSAHSIESLSPSSAPALTHHPSSSEGYKTKGKLTAGNPSSTAASRLPWPSAALLMPLKKANVAASGAVLGEKFVSLIFWIVTCVCPTMFPPLSACGAA